MWTTSNGYTPGPWQVGNGEIYAVNGVRRVAWTGISKLEGTQITDEVEGLANARLIAATPELVEALGDCFSLLKGYDLQGKTEGEVATAARAALAKALGHD